MFCEICGKLLKEEEELDGICLDCQSAMLQDDDIDLGIEDDDGLF